MSKYAALASLDHVAQTEQIDPRQVKNNAGGFVFALDNWSRLDRFLILGSDRNSYYQTAEKLTRDNAGVVEQCWREDAVRTAARIVEISLAGRAPKVSPTIFALALGEAMENAAANQAARAAVSKVCRTASHLMEYIDAVTALGRGWGRGFKRSIADWYGRKEVDALGYQMVKYRNRNGLSHSRILRTAHPGVPSENDRQRSNLYRWARGMPHDAADLPKVVIGHEAAMAAETAPVLIKLIEAYGLTWEAVPNWALKDADVWRALLPNLPFTALLRNLAALTEVGVLRDLSQATAQVAARLVDAEEIKKSRAHPYAILQALVVYRSGRSVKGSRSWVPVREILDALDDAFYLAFGNVEATGKRHMLALDISGSMGTNFIGDVVSAREASAAMALVTAAVERRSVFKGFGHEFRDLDISPKMRLGDAVQTVSGLQFGNTDCALPMVHALKEGIEVDAFVVYTDNETWYGDTHPVSALRRYRKETGINAKLIVVGMTSSGFTIADPADPGTLDVVGFDAGAISIVSKFVAS